MIRILPYFNFLGVIGLAALCVVQWQNNRQLNLNNIALDQIRQNQANKLAENDRTIQGQAADLEEFRGRLTLSEAQLKERIRKFGEHKTMIIVTHRSSLMDLADRIIVLDDGVVVADGPKEKVIAALQAGQVTRAA